MSFKFTKSEKIYLTISVLIYTGICLYKIIQFPITIDEACTYLWFTSKDIFTCATYYPSTNNHVLFSLIANVFDHLPFETKINMRLPNLILGIFFLFLIFVCLRNLFNEKTAVLLHLILVFSHTFLLYTILARGYMLYIVFASISFFCLLKIIENQKNKKAWFFLSLTTILGLFTIPTFLYFVASSLFCLIIISINNKKTFTTIAINYFIVGVSVLILYLPIFFVTGIRKIITNNPHLNSKSLIEIWDCMKVYINGLYDVLLGIRSDYILIPLVLVLVFMFRSANINTRWRIFFILSFFILPIFFIFIQRIIPIARMFSYLIFPFVVGVGIILSPLIQKMKNTHMYIVYLLTISTQMYIFQRSHPNAESKRDLDYENLAERPEIKDLKSFYFHPDSLYDEDCILRFHLENAKKNYISSINFDVVMNKTNLNPLNYNFDCIILKGSNVFEYQNCLPQYRQVYKNNKYTIYRLNKTIPL